MVKVLHAADFHLDSAFGALPEEKARLRRRESRGIPARLVEWANDHGAQLMLLAGDLFDSDNLYGQTAQELADALGRFRGRVFIAPGNHDFYAAHGPWGAAVWPENVHIFTSGRPVCVDEPELGCAVWGAAFTAAEEADGSALTAVRCPDDGRTHLMVLHADLSAPDSRYRPITPAQIGETGLSYLALGHTHAFSGVLHAGRTTFAYPGCPEGRGFDELGEKGSEPTSRTPHRSTPLSACSRCGRRRTSTASSSPASARRTSRSPRCRAVLRIAFSSWSCATRHARRRISGRAAERTPCVVCSCRRCTASSSPPPRRIARPLNRRCASALQRWITATCKEDI